MHKAFNIKEQYFMDDPREGERLERKANADEFVDKYIKKHLDNLSAGRVLEAGCGPGMFLKVLANRYANYTIVGIDISDERIQQAKTKLSGLDNAEVIKADIYKLPFPD